MQGEPRTADICCHRLKSVLFPQRVHFHRSSFRYRFRFYFCGNKQHISPADMQACAQGAQISGLGPLRQLVQPGCWCAAAAAAAAAHLSQPQRCGPARAAAAYATASSEASPSKPLFSSRAKIADACVPWLKGTRNRWGCAGAEVANMPRCKLCPQ